MNRRTPLLFAAALAMCTVGVRPVWADAKDADQKADAAMKKIAESPEQAPDRLFVMEAAEGNLWEVKVGQMVASKAQDQQVKDLAQQMVRDHQQANDRLMQIAQKLGLDLPTDLTSDKQGKLDVLAALPPDQLEMAYLMDMRADHMKDVTAYADHQNAVKDQDLKTYVSETLPKLQQHLQHVMRVSSQKGMQPPPMMGGGMGGMHGNMGGMGDNNASGTTAGNPNAPGRTSGQDQTGPQPNPTPAR